MTISAIPGLPFLNRDSTGVLLVDHQVGLLSGVRDITTDSLTNNLVRLIRVANVFSLPVIVTNVSPQLWGPFLPQASAELDGVEVIERTTINAWDDPRIPAAVKASGRTQWLVAGISLEVCAAFPALSAKQAGLDPRVVTDASGTFYDAKREAGLSRLQMAGISIVDYATAAVELLHDNADPLAGATYGAMDMAFSNIVGELRK